jgi:hypothetical protein
MLSSMGLTSAAAKLSYNLRVHIHHDAVLEGGQSRTT